MDASDISPEWLPHIEVEEGLTEIERGLRIAGWREIFEETGLLPHSFADVAQDNRKMPFKDVIASSGKRLPLHHLHLAARWITPALMKRRFDTYFFLCALDGGEAIWDGFEIVDAEWINPAAALAKGQSGEFKLLFPTQSELQRLAQSNTVDAAIAAAKARQVTVIEPRHERHGDKLRITIPPDAGYDVWETWFDAG